MDCCKNIFLALIIFAVEKISADDDSLEEHDKTRVLGIGVGIFTLLLLGFVFVVVCLASTATRTPVEICCGLLVVYCVLGIILLSMQKETQYYTPSRIHPEYSFAWRLRYVWGFLMLIGACAATGLSAHEFCMRKLHAFSSDSELLYQRQDEYRRRASRLPADEVI